MFHGAFADRIERILDRVPGVKGWLWVDDGAGPARTGPPPTTRRPSRPPAAVRAPWGRSGDDLLMLYTGGTTGMPKGVMWRQDDLFARLIAGGVRHYPVDGRDRRRCASARSTASPMASPSCRPARSCTAPAGSPPTPAWPRAGGSACSSPQVRPGRAARHGRAREGERPRHRRRPLLPPAAGCARRAAGALGPELAHDDGLVGRHVERVDQAGAAAPPPRHAAGGRLQLVGGARHGDVGVGRRRGGRRPSSRWARTSRCSTTTARR